MAFETSLKCSGDSTRHGTAIVGLLKLQRTPLFFCKWLRSGLGFKNPWSPVGPCWLPLGVGGHQLAFLWCNPAGRLLAHARLQLVHLHWYRHGFHSHTQLVHRLAWHATAKVSMAFLTGSTFMAFIFLFMALSFWPSMVFLVLLAFMVFMAFMLFMVWVLAMAGAAGQLRWAGAHLDTWEAVAAKQHGLSMLQNKHGRPKWLLTAQQTW